MAPCEPVGYLRTPETTPASGPRVLGAGDLVSVPLSQPERGSFRNPGPM